MNNEAQLNRSDEGILSTNLIWNNGNEVNDNGEIIREAEKAKCLTISGDAVRQAKIICCHTYPWANSLILLFLSR